jgi:hypothetical protein
MSRLTRWGRYATPWDALQAEPVCPTFEEQNRRLRAKAARRRKLKEAQDRQTRQMLRDRWDVQNRERERRGQPALPYPLDYLEPEEREALERQEAQGAQGAQEEPSVTILRGEEETPDTPPETPPKCPTSAVGRHFPMTPSQRRKARKREAMGFGD